MPLIGLMPKDKKLKSQQIC